MEVVLGGKDFRVRVGRRVGCGSRSWEFVVNYRFVSFYFIAGFTRREMLVFFVGVWGSLE